ncbi:unnamed protein product [Prorocentrum cordatum]|uniref:Uncharacterized protein n=1 Tax=Prorocentrum cordatum TaxID=2364126 RepID=A0ABN9QKI8_9DINO|nr:unnamed protein product [Polarella glacialis]
MACSALPLRSRQRLEQGRRLNIRLLLQEALKTGTSTGTGECLHRGERILYCGVGGNISAALEARISPPSPRSGSSSLGGGTPPIVVLLLTSGPAILLRSKREWRGYASRGKRHCASKAEHLHQLLLAIATKIEGKKPTPTTTTPTIEAV